MIEVTVECQCSMSPPLDSTIATLRNALNILGTNGVFTTKVVTLKLKMQMREIVKQQPRDQREAHWQRLLRYLHAAEFQLPEPPRQWPPDPGDDDDRDVREREYKISEVNVSCRDEQNVKAEDRLTSSQDRPDAVRKVWKDELKKLCLARRMPSTATCASNVCSGESSSHTMVSWHDCAGQLPVKKERAGAPNLAEQSRQQRIDLQQADGRPVKFEPKGVLEQSVHGILNCDHDSAKCIQLLGRSSGRRARSANASNGDQSPIDLRSIECQGSSIRSPGTAYTAIAGMTTELDLSAQDLSETASRDATMRTGTAVFNNWKQFMLQEEDMIPSPAAMKVACAVEREEGRLTRNQTLRDTVDQVWEEALQKTRFAQARWKAKRVKAEIGRIQAIGLQHDQGDADDTEMSLAGSNETANGTNRDIKSAPECADDRAGESSAKRVRRACIMYSKYKTKMMMRRHHLRAQAVRKLGRSRYNAKVKLELPVEVSNTSETVQDREKRVWTFYSDADQVVNTGEACKSFNVLVTMRQAAKGIPAKLSNTSKALHGQLFSGQPLAAHVAPSVAKSPAELAAQARLFEAQTVHRDSGNAGADQQRGSNAGQHTLCDTVQIDQEHSSQPRVSSNGIPSWLEWQATWAKRSENKKSAEPVQHDSVEMRVKYGGVMNRGSKDRAKADCQ